MPSARGLIIAIDGPVGSGKSTVARRLATRLGYRYVDTGATYRALAWKALALGVDLRNGAALADLAASIQLRMETGGGEVAILLNGEDVTRAIRSPEIDEASSLVAVWPEVRARLVATQRALAGGGGAVVEGRDIGTVVFPDADVKFYLEADLTERAARRHREQVARGAAETLAAVRRDLERRDRRDAGRAASPLRPAADALMIDSSGRSVEEVVVLMVAAVRRRTQRR